MKNIISKILLLFFSINLYALPSLAAEDTIIYLVSQDNDGVGENGSFVFDKDSGILDVSAIKPAISKTIKGFSLTFYHFTEDSWQFKFVVPSKHNIQNKMYRYIQSYPYQFSTKPGMKVCKIFQDYLDLTGEFKILDFSIDSEGEIMSLAVDFKQVADTKGALFGSIRYHSDIDLTTDFESWEESPDLNTSILHEHVLGFYSEPNDWIGQGKDFIIESRPFNVYNYSNDRLKVYATGKDGGGSIVLTLRPANGGRLYKGLYLMARKANLQYPTYHGLDVSYNGRACNKVYGSFEVLEIAYNDTGDVVKLALDFVQHNEQPYFPALRGSIRYNSHLRPSTEDEIKARLE